MEMLTKQQRSTTNLACVFANSIHMTEKEQGAQVLSLKNVLSLVGVYIY